MTRQLLGKPVSELLLQSARAKIQELGSEVGPPVFASVHLGSGGPFSFYLKQQERSSKAIGVQFRDVALPETTTTDQLRERVLALERDPSIHAVLVQHPLPAGVDFRAAVDELSPQKDVDGVGSVNLGRLVEGAPIHAPAVALAVLQVLRHYSIPTPGRRIAVVGRSATVGLPLALLLARRGPSGDATVTIAHSRTPKLADCLRDQEVVVSCAGAPGLLRRETTPKGAVVVDVGLSSVADPSAPSGARAVGDADAASLDGWVEALTPVPGGVGPVTAAQLMENVVAAWRFQTGGFP